MPFVDMEKIPGSKIPRPFERELKVIMSPETHSDVNGFTLMMSTLAPEGGCTDFHTHDTSGELMIILSGRGKALLAGEVFELRAGVSMYAPPGVIHKTINTGSEPLKIACVFVPPVDASYINANRKAAQETEEKDK